jgi:ElaB/YqjD/DUF883 family membrane-anchored ribosome-binding protein
VADEVTPPELATPEKTPEEIERDMAQTRESITEKVTALEHQVVGTVQTAADTITETVETVKSIVTQAPAAVTDTVKHAAEAVSETVRETFDLTGHVRRHPWPAVGSAALLGCVTGWLFTRRRASEESAPAAVAATPPPAPPSAAPTDRSGGGPGLLDELFGLLGAQGKELARTALESVAAAIKQSIQENAPKLVSEAASRLTRTGGSEEPLAHQCADRPARA